MHYEKQNSYRDENHNLKRPDVVIKLPANRSIIIDSKVSLVDYDAYIRSQSDAEKNIAAKKLADDFKKHIDNLASKDYTHYDIGTLQYVFMFVPIEGAFSVALGADSSLYEYALKKHIAIVTPMTLTVSLRTIYLYWQSEKSSEFALKLFEEAGKLYDKVSIFSETFVKIGDQLQTVQKSYEKAHGQLAAGSGNILKRVSNLKALGAKTTKNLSTTKIEYDDFDEESATVTMIEQKEQEDGN
jgi:DNA recombination protein RmuC